MSGWTWNRRKHRLSTVGVALALIAFVAFPWMCSAALGSWLVGVPVGLVVAVLACEPAGCSGRWIWHK